LGKECRPAETIRKRNVRTAASKTAQLEEKLDGLVSLLKAANQAAPNANGFSSDDVQIPELLTPITTASESKIWQSVPPTVPSIFPTTDQAEECFKTFRDQKAHYFPFIHIPPTSNAQQLLRERPFLWLCIMAVSSKSATQQLALGGKVRQILGRRMLIELEKDHDLLLGLLAYIGWYATLDSILKLPSEDDFSF